MCERRAPVGFRGQLLGVAFSPSAMWIARDSTQIVKHNSRHIYPLSHLASLCRIIIYSVFVCGVYVYVGEGCVGSRQSSPTVHLRSAVQGRAESRGTREAEVRITNFQPPLLPPSPPSLFRETRRHCYRAC